MAENTSSKGGMQMIKRYGNKLVLGKITTGEAEYFKARADAKPTDAIVKAREALLAYYMENSKKQWTQSELLDALSEIDFQIKYNFLYEFSFLTGLIGGAAAGLVVAGVLGDLGGNWIIGFVIFLAFFLLGTIGYQWVRYIYKSKPCILYVMPYERSLIIKKLRDDFDFLVADED